LYTCYIFLNYRKANQKILELESEFKVEENINECILKIKGLQNQLECEKKSRCMEIEEKIAIISEKGLYIN